MDGIGFELSDREQRCQKCSWLCEFEHLRNLEFTRHNVFKNYKRVVFSETGKYIPLFVDDLKHSRVSVTRIPRGIIIISTCITMTFFFFKYQQILVSYYLFITTKRLHFKMHSLLLATI